MLIPGSAFNKEFVANVVSSRRCNVFSACIDRIRQELSEAGLVNVNKSYSRLLGRGGHCESIVHITLVGLTKQKAPTHLTALFGRPQCPEGILLYYCILCHIGRVSVERACGRWHTCWRH